MPLPIAAGLALKGAGGFLKKHWKPIVIGLLLVFAIWKIDSNGYNRAARHFEEKERKRQAESVAFAQRVEKRANEISSKLHREVTIKIADVRATTRTIQEKVPYYVTKQDDALCRVPAGYVLLHNSTVSGRDPGLPEASSGPSEPAPGVTLSTILGVSVHNIGVAHEYRVEVEAWRKWYSEQLAAWPVKDNQSSTEE